MRKSGFIFLLILVMVGLLNPFPGFNFKEVEAQASGGSISFQPSEMPNIGFKYNPAEYQFEITWKTYYLNIKPFAIYNGQYFNMKQIIPVLKNNYPNIDYRTAVNKFKNFHRWGFWLEKLPQNVADNLDYLGFDVSDTNIPLNAVEVETIEGLNFTYKQINIGGRFSIDFYDLYERGFEVTLNKTTILIGNVKGETDLDLDPVTYSAPTITVSGYSKAVPCTFWDVWNASFVNGWGVVHNNQLNSTQYQFDAKLVIGTGAIETWFNDTDQQILITDGVLGASWAKFIAVYNLAHLTLGKIVRAEYKIGDSGVSFILNETTSSEVVILGNTHVGGEINLYSCSFSSLNNILAYVSPNGNAWNNIFGNRIGVFSSAGGAVTITDAHRNLFTGNKHGSINPSGTWVDNVYLGPNEAHYVTSTGAYTLIRDYVRDITFTTTTWNWAGVIYFIDCDYNKWAFIWAGPTQTGNFTRQNTLNVLVVDSLGNPVKNADITLTHAGQGGGIDYSGSTPTNGTIPEQTVTKGFYNSTGGDTIYSLEPYNLTISKIGYETTNLIFNVSEPITWTVPFVLMSVDVITNVDIITEEIWVALFIWVFLLLFGYYKRKDPVFRVMAGILGVVLGILVLDVPWVLVGLVVVGLNLYILYGALTEWR